MHRRALYRGYPSWLMIFEYVVLTFVNKGVEKRYNRQYHEIVKIFERKLQRG
jgi:hypothetical protein